MWKTRNCLPYIINSVAVDGLTTQWVCVLVAMFWFHDDVIKWKHFSRYWPFVRGIHRCPVNYPHKGQWRGTAMFSLICAWINGWVNNHKAGDLRRHRAHYDVNVMIPEDFGFSTRKIKCMCAVDIEDMFEYCSKMKTTSLYEHNGINHMFALNNLYHRQ